MRALPPDHTSQIEWPMWVGIAGALTRATAEGVLVLLLFCFALVCQLAPYTVPGACGNWVPRFAPIGYHTFAAIGYHLP